MQKQNLAKKIVSDKLAYIRLETEYLQDCGLGDHIKIKKNLDQQSRRKIESQLDQIDMSNY